MTQQSVQNSVSSELIAFGDALRMVTVAVEIKAVVRQRHAVFLRDLILPLLDDLVVKLDHASTVEADQMVMMFLMSQLKN